MLTGSVYTYDTLTAPGATLAQAAETFISYQVTVANINTTVTIQVEASVDGTNYGVIPIRDSLITVAADKTVTLTANGTYIFSWAGSGRFIRFRFVSEVGGTAATLDVKAWVQ
jgi:hypothetical protein